MTAAVQNLSKYLSYKASGVDWIGEVPSHWDVVRFKHGLLLVTAKGGNEDHKVALENIESWTGRYLETETTYEGEGTAFRAGDILFGKLRPYLAKAFLAVSNGQAVGDFHVLQPAAQTNPRFAQYFILSRDFISIVDGSTYGAKMPRASWDFISSLPLPLPPSAEQAAIAAFLDRETAKIDRLVDEQRRLIDLLKEKRQAVISYAVTKGLDPDVPMKDTGIEWLGEVPEHWDVARLKHIAEVRGRIGFRGYTADDLVAEGEGALALGGANLSDSGRLSLDNRTYLSWEKYEESPEIKIQTGDVLIGQRGTCGRSVVIDRDIGPATINPSLVVLKELKLHPQFVTYWLMGDFSQKTFDSYLQKTAVPMLSQQQIGNLPISFPELEEQQQICLHIDRKLKEFHDLLKSCQAGIVLLEERRAALISAAVTGKIDVRDQHHCVEAAGS